jgi:hypothetical protein
MSGGNGVAALIFPRSTHVAIWESISAIIPPINIFDFIDLMDFKTF